MLTSEPCEARLHFAQSYIHLMDGVLNIRAYGWDGAGTTVIAYADSAKTIVNVRVELFEYDGSNGASPASTPVVTEIKSFARSDIASLFIVPFGGYRDESLSENRTEIAAIYDFRDVPPVSIYKESPPGEVIGGSGSDTFINGIPAIDRGDSATFKQSFSASTVWSIGPSVSVYGYDEPGISQESTFVDAHYKSVRLVGTDSANTLRMIVGNVSLSIDLRGGDDFLAFSDPAILNQDGTLNDAAYLSPDPEPTVATRLIGGTGNDTIYGSGGADAIFGGVGDDRLFGGASRDYLSGDAGNDQLGGGDGDDELNPGTGTDALSGGAGRDLANYGTRTVSLTLTLDGLANDGEPDENDNVAVDIEDVLGGAGSDRIRGSRFANRLHGGAGNDRIWGGSGNDSITGGAGNDRLDGQSGADRFYAADGAIDLVLGGPGNNAGYVDKDDWVTDVAIR